MLLVTGTAFLLCCWSKYTTMIGLFSGFWWAGKEKYNFPGPLGIVVLFRSVIVRFSGGEAEAAKPGRDEIDDLI